MDHWAYVRVNWTLYHASSHQALDQFPFFSSFFFIISSSSACISASIFAPLLGSFPWDLACCHEVLSTARCGDSSNEDLIAVPGG
jgi:hypothetical protein